MFRRGVAERRQGRSMEWKPWFACPVHARIRTLNRVVLLLISPL